MRQMRADNSPLVRFAELDAMQEKKPTPEGKKHDRKPRVVVIYHFYPHYRKPIVEALARSESVDFTFVGDDHEYLNSIQPSKFSDRVKFRLARTHRLIGPFMWQWGAITWAIRPGFDIVIMHPVAHWPCTWIGAILARLIGREVMFWGHGYLYEPKGLKGLVRRAFNALPTSHLFYGRISKAIAINNGWEPERLHVIYNSLDTDAQAKILSRLTPDRISTVRKAMFGTDAMPLVCCTSRLIQVRRLDLLVQAMGILRKRGLEAGLVLVGDGPERAKLESMARGSGLPVHFEGETYDEERIAELVASCNVTVAPGKVGLTAIHSMAYGVPVVTHDDYADQMPEFEAVIPGKTGSFFKHGSVESLADAMEPWLKTHAPDPAVRDACIGIVRRFWNVDYQQRAIERAVLGMPADDIRT
ncbi:MAG: glycosyltransferase [Proteobacteria bacterium]|nr:glycosyltransferase [Pseudomonadota bacterium]